MSRKVEDRLVIEAASFSDVDTWLTMLTGGWMGLPPSNTGEVAIRCDRADACRARLVVEAAPGESLDKMLRDTAQVLFLLWPGGLDGLDVLPDAKHWRELVAALERLARARGSIQLEGAGSRVDTARQLQRAAVVARAPVTVRRRLLPALERAERPVA